MSLVSIKLPLPAICCLTGKEDQERIVSEERRKIAESERRHKNAFVGSVLGSVLIKQLSMTNQAAEIELSKR